jgi:ABC-type bacteriocin/lantibiotic exporter with double-glycine peptidase domain
MSETEYTHNLSKLTQRLFGHISLKRKRQISLLLILTLLSSIAEVVSIGAVVPFIGALIEPEKIFESPYFADAVALFWIESPQELIMPLSLIFVVAVIMAGCLRLSLLWVSTRLGNAIGVDLGVDILRRTLYQPYKISLDRNSSEIVSAMTMKLGFATNILVSTITIVVSLFLFLSIIAVLVTMNPFIAFCSAVIFGLAYWAIVRRTQKRLINNSDHIAREQTNVIRSLQDGLGAIRDILIDGTQDVYVNLYHSAASQLQKAVAENTFINQAPRFLMESAGIVLIVLIALVFSGRPEGVSSALPILAMLALGAQRLLPIMQQLYSSWAAFSGNRVALEELLELLEQEILLPNLNQSVNLPFSKELSIKNMTFRYAPEGPKVIDSISLNIPVGSRVGIIGSTGCGKSTLLDLIMGLLSPDKGNICIDNIPLSQQNMRAWQKKIAHVPQSIFMADASVAENIAFGINPENIDMAKVRAAAEQAQAAEFIESKLCGYETRIGEKGALLSGGQRQRIGIARALYKQAELLIFDEATSALDSDTENSVMMAINELSQNLTLIIVAHRITTLRNCDFIIELEAGRIKKKKSYDVLSQFKSR